MPRTPARPLLLLAGVMLGGCALAWSQPAKAGETQVWGSVTLNAGIARAGTVRLWLDGQVRTRASSDEVDTSVVRPGLGVRLAPGTELFAGYARVTSHRPGPDILEDRLWQQLSYPLGTLGGVALSGRTRLEQRLRTNAGETGWRLRQALRATLPTGVGSLALVASNELFLGLNETGWGQPSGFDQNRGFVGVAVMPVRPVRIEAGFMGQRIERPGGRDRRRQNIALSTTLTF